MAQVEEEINRDVWYPFIESFTAFDADAFIALHTGDVVRSIRDGGTVLVGEEYFETVRKNMSDNLEKKAIRDLYITFEQRVSGENAAYEIGYYKVRHASGGQERIYFGKFHVTHQKVDGQWKIAVDADTSDEVTEESFVSGTPLEIKY